MTWHHANDWCMNENFTGLARIYSREADLTIKMYLESKVFYKLGLFCQLLLNRQELALWK